MSLLRPTDTFGISSSDEAADGDLLTKRAPVRLDRSNAGMDEVGKSSISARITELLGGQEFDLGRDYRFEQLPASNDQIVVLNRRGLYDIMRVLYSADEPETTVYVRWVAHR
jgi:hypothetical protein